MLEHPHFSITIHFIAHTHTMRSDQRKINLSPFTITLISLSIFGVLLVTKDITLIAKITLSWPDLQILVKEPQENSNNPIHIPQPIDNKAGSKSETPTQTETEKVITPASPEQKHDDVDEEEGSEEVSRDGCDFSNGKWVFDNVTRPSYKEEECEFLTEQVTCLRNGRVDTLYQNWRWQPNHCSLPKFKAGVLLEKVRGKRFMFVGDSVNRNQWESLICLVLPAIPPGRATWKTGSPLSVFYVKDYNATFEFYWSPFLVESNSDDSRNHSISQRIIIPESISRHGDNWRSADFLVFNTYIWWMNSHSIKVSRGTFDQGWAECDDVERSTAYERVLTTWAKWVKNNVDHNRTSSFFISMSPVHQQSDNWNNPDGAACALETTPILNASIALEMGTDRRLLEVANKVIKDTKVPVTLIDITTLSEYRKDAHTSVYTLRQGKLLTPEQKADPATFADCLHWCLPGVPDTWNELLYAHIIFKS